MMPVRANLLVSVRMLHTVACGVLGAVLVACDGTPADTPITETPLPPAGGVAPTPPNVTDTAQGLAGVIGAADAAQDTSSQRALPRPDDPSRLLFLGMEAPTSPLWQWQPPRSSAWIAQWIVPGPQSSAHAELVMWSSKVDAVDLARDMVPVWERQFKSGVIPKPATVTRRTIGGMDVHLVELAGEYTGMGGGWHRPDYRQMTAIVAGTEGTVVIRMLGANITVEANREAFLRMIEGLRTTQ